MCPAPTPDPILLSYSTTSTRPVMASTPSSNSLNSVADSEVLHEFVFFNVLKDGRVNLFNPKSEKIPAADDPITGVKIKDVQISADVSARLFLPPAAASAGDPKFPVLLYLHGGGFCMRSAFSSEYTNHVAGIVAGGDILAVSVEYGLFPSRPLPACYEDSWEALLWIAAHAGGGGSEPWLNRHADLNRLFIAGDSAGGNICHFLAARVGSVGLPGGVGLAGMVLVHPYFGEDDKMWMYMCPTNEGPTDRRMKPAKEDLARVGAARVLVLVAENDAYGLREVGRRYAAELVESGWKGTVELVENKGKEHTFHLGNPQDEEAVANRRRIIDFIHCVGNVA